MARVRVGLVGSGFVAETAYVCLQAGLWVRCPGDRSSRARRSCPRFRQEASDTPYLSRFPLTACRQRNRCGRHLHAARVAREHEETVQAGKHVICEKPFTGYFGRDEDKMPVGKHVPKSRMYGRVTEEMDKTCAAINASGCLFMYAEDWIYAPAVTKTVEILKATKDKILFMKVEESHSGSHAAHAAQWAMTGGGSLIRMGCHPLSTVLYLNQVESRSRGERIAISGVVADVGNVAACLAPHDRPFINANPVDVEDWGMLTVTFSDGTKSTVFSGDMIMGGVRNVVETYTSGGALFANITPNNHMTSYLTNEEKLAGVYITEKVDRKTGWQFICLARPCRPAERHGHHRGARRCRAQEARIGARTGHAAEAARGLLRRGGQDRSRGGASAGRVIAGWDRQPGVDAGKQAMCHGARRLGHSQCA
jgi:predicted dehydrogenase